MCSGGACRPHSRVGNPAWAGCAHPVVNCNDTKAAVTKRVDDDCDGQIDERTGCGDVARTDNGADGSAAALAFVLGLAAPGVVRRLRPTRGGAPTDIPGSHVGRLLGVPRGT